MVLDILYHDRAPEQIQNVRLATLYTTPAGKYGPELVIHSTDNNIGQRNIPLREIKEVKYWNE